jgi:hypothetical protein
VGSNRIVGDEQDGVGEMVMMMINNYVLLVMRSQCDTKTCGGRICRTASESLKNRNP